MATVTLNIGHIEDDLGLLVNVQSPKPPFQHGVGIWSKELIVGTDFTSGDDIVFSIEGTDKVRYAHFTSNVGATINYAETNGSAPLRKILTLSSVTTNVKAYIVFDT